MLNLMRAMFLERASGILSVDVDEFVLPMPSSVPHRTIFDMARANYTGCVSFLGKWAFAQEASDPQPQRAHSHTDPDRLCRNPKWCLVPGSLADRFVLAVHRPAGPLFAFTRTSVARYWHFQATTTGWKAPRFEMGIVGNPDGDLAQALKDHLPSQ
jgi:hypothetical protein